MSWKECRQVGRKRKWKRSTRMSRQSKDRDEGETKEGRKESDAVVDGVGGKGSSGSHMGAMRCDSSSVRCPGPSRFVSSEKLTLLFGCVFAGALQERRGRRKKSRRRNDQVV
ncbi:hypothetical protein LSTR_LSTR007390 [Laodelphax striatellus]|uniref:Uncharacterized protein n=1 Tax=Laodelphax striatellus TaxID=195883 RepID=A0A482XNI0_LAOST|nr:hypothetical protein LSTR_LSTR007390 [Laodelphax striatellus]